MKTRITKEQFIDVFRKYDKWVAADEKNDEEKNHIKEIKMKILRQGDVTLRPSKIKSDATLTDSMILAEGEMTGHAHRIVAGQVEVYRQVAQGLMYLKVLSDMATLFHEEHEDVYIPKGEYEVKTQREWDWFSEEVRRVTD